MGISVVFFAAFYIGIYFALIYLKNVFYSIRFLGLMRLLRHGLYRHVADGKEKSGKLVLVDSDKYCFYSFVLYKRLCFYFVQYVGFIVAGNSWSVIMDRQSKIS